jgi:hypothetical protein
MAGSASSRTVSASTDSTAPAAGTEAPRTALGRAAAPFAAAGHAASGQLSRFWTTPGWRRAKTAADRVLLCAIAAAVGWAVVNGVFTAQRATANRAVVLVHLASQPAVQVVRPGLGTKEILPTGVLSGTRTEKISIAVANDGPDGVTLKGGTLSGPFLVGTVQLKPDASGYIVPTGVIHLTGEVSVDCDAAASTAAALMDGAPSPQRQATTASITVADANKDLRQTDLVVDTTAFAVQGQVCTS